MKINWKVVQIEEYRTDLGKLLGICTAFESATVKRDSDAKRCRTTAAAMPKFQEVYL